MEAVIIRQSQEVLFYDSEETFNAFRGKLKLKLCPHCGLFGFLILHGFLYGFLNDAPLRVIRGHRIVCSNRHRKNGCGRTFSIFRSIILKRLSISSQWLLRLVNLTIAGLSVYKALRTLTETTFCRSTATRFRQRFIRAQSSIRARLLTLCAPPPDSSSDPLLQTLQHLSTAFSSASCPVAAFQMHFNRSFL
jgi:hypothetical protein